MTWTNGFTLLVPIFIWNLLFTFKLPREYNRDDDVAAWLLTAEGILRLAVFGLPLLLTMRLGGLENRIGLTLYLAGTLLYFSAWLIEIFAPYSLAAEHPAVLLAPYYMPLAFLAGIGLMGGSYLYIGLVVLFTLFHTYHGLLSLGFLAPAGIL